MWIIAYLFFLHFLADFILQPREMARSKSTKFGWLLGHLGIQWAVFLIGLAFIDLKFAIYFSLINAIVHGLIDWQIWNLYKLFTCFRIEYQIRKEQKENQNWTKDKYLKEKNKTIKNWKYWEDHWFYCTIGLDQLLHFTTILILYWMSFGFIWEAA